MLKFLTHKLRTHSLNEEHPNNKIENEEHDSGTESDENGSADSDFIMGDGSMSSCSPASLVHPGITATTANPATPSPYFLDSGLPSDCDLNYEHHSSEEELEVINSNPKEEIVALSSRSRSASSLAEKRKWSQVNETCSVVVRRPLSHHTSTANIFNNCAPSQRRENSSSSSDDEVHGLLAAVSTPVQFRTSPPVDVHKPGHRSLSPPVKLFHYGSRPRLSPTQHSVDSAAASSPRKRHRHKLLHKSNHHPNHIHRPCLDFEKMQQLKARAVTTWRPNAEHGGELSVFCW